MEFSPISKFAKKVPRKGSGLYYDPIYGYVPLPDYLREAMDLDVFQRLQGIKQLSTVYLTFRGAVHTRFDHCVGTAYLASILFNRLGELVDKSDTDGPKMNLILEASISLAALFHDVGHGPFGHIFEMFCRRAKKTKGWTHERMAEKLITGKDESGNDINDEPYKQIKRVLEKIKAIFGNADHDAENIALLNPTNIYNIASGKPPDLGSEELNNKYYFLKDIIASSYGLDRLDYLKRDAYYSGVNTGNIDIGEIISSLVLKKDKDDDKYKLFLKTESMSAVETLLQSRNLVYRRLYHNSVHRSAQELIIRGLMALQCEPKDICLRTDNEILTKFSDKGGLPSEISERVKFRILYEKIHLCSHAFIREHKAALQKYREMEGRWFDLKALEDKIAKNAEMDKDCVFYDIEIIPAVKSEDFKRKMFFDEIEETPQNLFDLAPHLYMIYGVDPFDGHDKAEYFNESVSDIIVCFPYDAIVNDIEKLRSTKGGAELENGIDELYTKRLEPLVKGFFSEILKVTESDSEFFEKHKEHFSKLKKKCVKYLAALTE